MKISNGVKEIIRKLIPVFVLDWYHFLLAFFGAVFYRFPSKEIIVIGVTGTSGKSTVIDFITRILEESGYKVASLSSIKFKIGNKIWENKLKMTMPGRFKIQQFLRQAVNAGCKYAVLEVTSEGIKQHRHRFINFEAAVFTNLSPEHIESHGSFENYRNCKGKLFQKKKKIHIINLDDENSEYFLKFPAEVKYYFSTKDPKGETDNLKIIKAYGIKSGFEGLDFLIENISFKIKLLGEFNVYNALAAVCLGLSQRVSLEVCKKAIEKAEGVPGRMEIVIKEPFTVIVDYAITPVALEKVYQTLENLKPKAYNLEPKMICVLGACGGGRDKWKRPVLGKIADKYCKEIIITNEDPYDEDPMEIINQVAEGAGTKPQRILDRREAIRKALQLAESNDIVIITGKGCEPWICVAGGKKIPWDDRQVVKEEFKLLKR